MLNSSSVLTDVEVASVVPALQRQVREDFAPVWGVDADLVFYPAGAEPPAGTWWIVILDNTDHADDAGYHDVTPEGMPIGKVFAGTDIAKGVSWTVTASHEILEMLVDPAINLSVFVERAQGQSQLYAYEVCDPCQADADGYLIDGVLVSDFVYPSWFEAFRPSGSARFDHTDRVREPFELSVEGSIGIFELRVGIGWQQFFQGPAVQIRPAVGSRRERRRTSRLSWQVSTATSGRPR